MSTIHRMPLQKNDAQHTKPRAALLEALRQMNAGEISEDASVLILSVNPPRPEEPDRSGEKQFLIAGPEFAKMTSTIGWLSFLQSWLIEEMNE